MSTRQGPALTITGTCEGCRHLAGTGNDLACRHPDAPPGATPYETLVGIEPTDGCPLLPAARLALLVSLASTLCRKCGRTVEPERECYAIPTCFACLPPPPPLPVLPSFAAWQKKQEEEPSK